MTIQLQINRNGSWANVGSPGGERVEPGGSSANRANARVVCVNTVTHQWRSVIDTPARSLACEPNSVKSAA